MAELPWTVGRLIEALQCLQPDTLVYWADWQGMWYCPVYEHFHMRRRDGQWVLAITPAELTEVDWLILEGAKKLDANEAEIASPEDAT